MKVSSSESRANDFAFKATAKNCGSCWQIWEDDEWLLYYTIYKAVLKYERNLIADKYYDEGKTGTI